MNVCGSLLSCQRHLLHLKRDETTGPVSISRFNQLRGKTVILISSFTTSWLKKKTLILFTNIFLFSFVKSWEEWPWIRWPWSFQQFTLSFEWMCPCDEELVSILETKIIVIMYSHLQTENSEELKILLRSLFLHGMTTTNWVCAKQ